LSETSDVGNHIDDEDMDGFQNEEEEEKVSF
jgi:hypothetical protein